MTIDQIIERILDHEGGIKDVGDGKGVTRFGQTPGWLSEHGLPKPYTPEEAGINYAVVFERFRIADVIRKDWFVGYVLADMAVHFGEGTAIRVAAGRVSSVPPQVPGREGPPAGPAVG
jgi:lysozyme family protein